MKDLVVRRLIEGARLMETISENDDLVEAISMAVELCSECIKTGGKICFMGNGGSAADSQHLATEFVSRYLVERKALPAIALTVDTSAITAIGNDYSFDFVFSRQIEALCNENDVVIGISTSGKSKNIIAGVNAANTIGCTTISLTGNGGGELARLAKHNLIVPSNSTPLIQQAHIAIGHILCELIEKKEASL